MRAKICKITDLFTALNAEDAGADFLGFVFDDKSDAYISPLRVEVIAQQIKAARLVGVFRDEDLKTVNHWANKIDLDYVQLDGNEDAEYARKVDRPVIKSFRYDDKFSVERAMEYPAEMIRLDFGGQLMLGFDRKKAIRDIHAVNKSVILAGDVDPKKVKKLCLKLQPYAFDTSIGMNGAYGIKDFLRHLKGNAQDEVIRHYGYSMA